LGRLVDYDGLVLLAFVVSAAWADAMWHFGSLAFRALCALITLIAVRSLPLAALPLRYFVLLNSHDNTYIDEEIKSV
jgi:hypothetical protein